MKKIISEKNPELVTRKDNKSQWNLPNKRRLGFRNLYKINRYGIYLRSDFVLKLKKKINKRIGKLSYVKKVTKNKAFCSLIVGKDQDIFIRAVRKGLFYKSASNNYVNYKNVYTFICGRADRQKTN